MLDLNRLFRQRIGFPEDVEVTFANLDTLLEKAAFSIPFENLCIMKNTREELTKENLMNKVLIRKEGGLCYELNPVLYLFLLEQGFNVTLIRGVVFSPETQTWSAVGRTHVAILLFEDGKTYLVDTGFGGNLPLKPVPITGETISSKNGEFRIKPFPSEHGNYLLEMKRKDKDEDWKYGYAFDTKRPIAEFSELKEIQTAIIEHEQSSFNKKPLITRLTVDGSITLTDNSRTVWKNGKMIKEMFQPEQLKELVKREFEIHYE